MTRKKRIFFRAISAVLVVLLSLNLSACQQKPLVQPLRSAPWEDGETTRYITYFEGRQNGTMTYTINKQIDGWHIDSVNTEKQGKVESGVVLSADTLNSLSSYYRQIPSGKDQSNAFSMQCKYSQNKMTITDSDPKQKPRTLGIPTYAPPDDNTVIAMILRTFDYSAKQPFQINLCMPFPYDAKTDLVNIGYVRDEVLTIGKRKIAAHVVKFGQYGSIKQPAITYWFSADEKQTLLQIDQGGGHFRYTLVAEDLP